MGLRVLLLLGLATRCVGQGCASLDDSCVMKGYAYADGEGVATAGNELLTAVEGDVASACECQERSVSYRSAW